MRSTETERTQRAGEFTDAVAAELIGVVDGQPGVLFPDHLAFFAQGARDDADIRTLRDIVGDSGAGSEGFVVRMGVDEQQAGRFVGHRPRQ